VLSDLARQSEIQKALEVRRALFPLDCALDSVLRKLRMMSLKAQIEVSRRQGEAFAGDFEKAESVEQKSEIARKWDRAIKAKHAAQVLLEMLERQQKEERATQDSGSAT
jgi:hypothetical protein